MFRFGVEFEIFIIIESETEGEELFEELEKLTL
jgi:hypothetical protein